MITFLVIAVVLAMLGVCYYALFRSKTFPYIAPMAFGIFMMSSAFAVYTNVNSVDSNTQSYSSNTVYQNNNSTYYDIYVSSNSQVRGWIGSDNTTSILAMNSIPGGTTNNNTAFVHVPLNWWFKFNYTGNAYFVTIYDR